MTFGAIKGCLLLLSALWFLSLTLEHSFSFVLPVFTCSWYTVISITCAPFAYSCLVPNILLSFNLVVYTRCGFVIIVLVFLVPHIEVD